MSVEKKFLDYELLEHIRHGDRVDIYRATHPQYNKVIVKLVHDNSQYHAYKSQCKLIKKLEAELVNVTGLLFPIAYKESQDKLALIYPETDSTDLHSLLEADKLQELSLADKLGLMCQLTSTVSELHASGFLHNQISPQHILYNQSSKQVYLIDLGLVSKVNLSQQQTSLNRIRDLKRTAPYVSPEQTGRFKARIDYRSDLYALGCVIYTILTHNPPFSGDDHLAVYHAHLATCARDISDLAPSTPAVLQDIVNKLIEKNPQDRYQTSISLKADITQCYNSFINTEEVAYFKIAENDISRELHLNDRLYGREKEQHIFKDIISNIGNSFSLLSVSATGGSGKTALVENCVSHLNEEYIYASGKYIIDTNNSYSALIQISQHLVEICLIRHDITTSVKQQLLTTLGNNATVLYEFIPNLERLLGKSEDIVAKLDHQEAVNRLHSVWLNFFLVFAKIGKKIILFIDDLQWLDHSSQELISMLLQSNSQLNNLLLVLAYRHDELDQYPLASNFINKINSLQINNVNNLKLNVLSANQISELLADTLHDTIDNVRELAVTIQLKTLGNPFVIRQLLNLLTKQKLLYFTDSKNIWQWDIAQINNLAIDDACVDLVLEQLVVLSSNLKQVLQLAAIVGYRFTNIVLSKIVIQDIHTIDSQLQDLVIAGFLSAIQDAELDYTRYQFQHDRIYEAAYYANDKQQRIDLHWQVALVLNKYFPIHKLDIAAQVNKSVSCIDKTDALTQHQVNFIVKANLAAAEIAYSRLLFASAYEHYKVVADIQDDSKLWQENYGHLLSLYKSLIETAYLTNKLADVDKYSALAISNIKDKVVQAEIYLLQIQAYVKANKMQQAITIGTTALRNIGIKIPVKPSQYVFFVTIFSMHLRFAWRANITSKLQKLQQMTNVKSLVAIKILSVLAVCSYRVEPNLFSCVVKRMLSLTMNYGNSTESAVAYSCYGILLCATNLYQQGYAYAKLALYSMEMKKNFAANDTLSWLVIEFFIMHWHKPLKDTSDELSRAYIQGTTNGSFLFSPVLLEVYAINAFAYGKRVSVLSKQLSEYMDMLDSEDNTSSSYIDICFHWQLLSNLSEENLAPTTLNGKYFQENQISQYKGVNVYVFFYIYKIQLCYWFNELDQVNHYIALAKSRIELVVASTLIPIFYFYQALVLAKQYSQGINRSRWSLRTIKKNAKKLWKWSQNCEDNFLHKFYLVEAEYNLCCGRKSRAIDVYVKSIELATKYGFVHEAAMAAERLADLYIHDNMDAAAYGYLLQARSLYEKWGAIAKIKVLDNKYNQYFFKYSIRHNALAAQVAVTSDLNFLSLNKLVQTISDSENIDNLLSKIARFAMENAGADRAVLVLQNNFEAQEGYTVFEYLAKQEQEINFPYTQQNFSRIPHNTIDDVLKNRKIVNLDTQPNLFLQDKYLTNNKPRSAIALPLIHQDMLKGVMYVENKHLSNLFFQQKLIILQLLSAQAATAVHTFTLYTNLLTSEKVKSEFLSNMSHEIRTPMNAILGFSNLLQHEIKINNFEQVNQYIGTIQESSVHLLGIIDDILDFSKLDAGKLTIESIDVDLQEILRYVSTLLSPKAKEKGIELHYHLDNAIAPIILSDPLRLKQILVNLVNNAVKFTTEGEVKVEISLQEVISDKVRILFDVTDTGVGISQEQQRKLFQPFAQADGSISRTFGGTGLGLIISDKLVKLMGGSGIKLKSQLGVGSSFSFILELEVSHTQTTDQDDKVELTIDYINKVIGKKTVLIVDDQAINRRLMHYYCTKSDLDLVAVADGESALKYLKEHKVDVILLDLHMPGKDGYHVISDLSTNQRRNVIALTGDSSIEIHQKCKKLGIYGVLVKPIEQYDLFMSLYNFFKKLDLDNIQEQNITSLYPNIIHKKILLVDDEIMNRKLITEYLKDVEVDITIGKDGVEALECMRHNYYDIVLLDIQMPKKDGIAVMHEISTSPDYQHLFKPKKMLLCVISANALVQQQQQYLEAGADLFISKPVLKKNLLTTLEEYLSSH